MQRSLARWKMALERAECLCAEMLKMRLPSCCVTQATELSPAKYQTMPSPKACCSSTSSECIREQTPTAVNKSNLTSGLEACCTNAGSENLRKQAPKAPTTSSLASNPKACCSTADFGSSSKICCSTTGFEDTQKRAPEGPATSSFASSSKACCSTTGFDSSAQACSTSSKTAKTCCFSPPGPHTRCASPLEATKYQCDTSVPAPKTSCPSIANTSSLQSHIARHSSPIHDNQPSDNLQTLVLADTDVERNRVLEHVVMHISGMTCTGCERKLERVLSSITGVYNVKTSLVLGRAEFDVDAGKSVNEVVLLVERQTEFRSTIHQGGHQLEVVFERALALLLQNPAGPEYPLGVEGIRIVDNRGQELKSGSTKKRLREALDFELFASKLDKCNIRISYDPSIVGARDLLEKSFGTPLLLVPVNSAHATAADTDYLY